METKIVQLIDEIKKDSYLCGNSSTEVNFVKSLVQNKCKDSDCFVCEGNWANQKLIKNNFSIPMFFVCTQALEKIEDLKILEDILAMKKHAQKTLLVSKKTCEKISDRDGADEFFVVVKAKTYTLNDIEKLINGKTEVLAMVTDGIEQPGNIGAILRSFDCAGGDFAILTNTKAKLNNSRLVRASLGASFLLPVVVAEIGEVQAWLEKNNFTCLVTDLSATKSFKDATSTGRIAIVGGNEHTGISNSWRTLKNAERIIIEMFGTCESLNVGFASTLVAYEIGLKKHQSKIKNKIK